jgi:hypothetical protein
MASWADLDTELDAWGQAGRKALFWWRDDDAGALTPALERLLALHEASSTPLSLAVIPQEATEALAERLAKLPGVAVLQHGFAHRNHAPAGEKKSEFPKIRPVAESLADLRQGRARLQSLFGRSLRPILVPPWNRIAANLLPQLPRLGLHGFSTYKPREDLWAAPGLMQVNTHLDPADWRQEAKFLGDDACLALALAHLRLARLDPTAPEPLGLLTHHARHDEAGWAFIARFIGHVSGHGAALWVDVESAFGAGPPPAGADTVIPRS